MTTEKSDAEQRAERAAREIDAEFELVPDNGAFAPTELEPQREKARREVAAIILKHQPAWVECQDAVLCYVRGNAAYFTTRDLVEQWGDDWDDAPYEHNAGSPYTSYCDGEKWRIVVLQFDGPFEQPCSDCTNSEFSVQQINAGATPWLRTESYRTPYIAIPAGTTVKRFCAEQAERFSLIISRHYAPLLEAAEHALGYMAATHSLTYVNCIGTIPAAPLEDIHALRAALDAVRGSK